MISRGLSKLKINVRSMSKSMYRRKCNVDVDDVQGSDQIKDAGVRQDQ
jgi:hypothetical protein